MVHCIRTGYTTLHLCRFLLITVSNPVKNQLKGGLILNLISCGSSGGKEEPVFDGHKEDLSFDQPGLGDHRGVEGGVSDNLVEMQFADAETGDSWGPRKQADGVTDANGKDPLYLSHFVCC